MSKLFKSFKKIQKADEVTRSRWLWLLTIGSSLIVISLWLIYINFTIDRVGGVNGRSEHSFFSVLNAGLLTIREQVADGLNVLLKEKSYDIEIPQKNFTYKELKDAPKVKLP